jgi:uncharacterized protein YdhG (YjbR/CyaY superfamily)
MPRPTFESVDAYLAAQSPATRACLERARATLRKALPRATESISYGIPVYKIDGAMILFFAGFARHWSIYPLTPALSRELGTELADRLQGKTIRFTLDERFPAGLVTRIAKVRAAEAAETMLSKAKTKARAPKRKAPKTRRR